MKRYYYLLSSIIFILIMSIVILNNAGKIKGEINGVSYSNCSGLAFQPNCALEKCAGLVASYLHDDDEKLYWEVSEMNCNLEKLLNK